MIGPSSRLLRLFAAWTGAALFVVAAPGLVPLAWSALVAIALVSVWDAWSISREPVVVATRTLPERAFVGQDIEIAIEVANAGSRDVAVGVIDEPASDLRHDEPVLHAAAVAAGGRSRMTYAARPERRGNRAFGPMLTLADSPLGLFRRRIVHVLLFL